LKDHAKRAFAKFQATFDLLQLLLALVYLHAIGVSQTALSVLVSDVVVAVDPKIIARRIFVNGVCTLRPDIFFV
jgi:hypothetical protein